MLIWLVGSTAFTVGLAIGVALVWRGRSVLRTEVEQARVEAARCEAFLVAEKEKTAWTDETKKQLRDAFSALASDELSTRSAHLRTEAKDELGGVVGPLKSELAKLDGYVRELESKREGAYSQIGTKLQLLQGQYESLKQQTTVLAEALKASSVRSFSARSQRPKWRVKS